MLRSSGPPSQAAFVLFVLAACASPVDTARDASNLETQTARVALTVDEEQEIAYDVEAIDVRRFDVEGLPPGARFDVATGHFSFVPDFTQSGTYTTTVTAHRREHDDVTRIDIVVRDAITPPTPVVVSRTRGEGYERLVVRQQTDSFLDSRGRAGRSIDAVVVVPSKARADDPAPVIVALHGFDGSPNAAARSTSTFRIEPHDPDNTYWWGYGDWLPGDRPSSGVVQPYTARRVLHLLDWLRRTQPGADPDRVFAVGASMGGAGAFMLGFAHARHFAGVESTISQPIARNHRPSRIAQLEALYGSAAVSDVWDTLDVTRILRDSLEARAQFVFTKHGKDDPTIHFGAVVTPSPLTGESFFEAIEERRIGHLAIWDEGAHGPPDPVLGEHWWDAGWSRIDDPVSYLSRRAPFPAFSRSNANERAIGDAPGNGKRPFDPETGYAARLESPGDTGWSGAIAGGLNRFLRWDARAIVDTPARLALPLFSVDPVGAPPPKPGYPSIGDRHAGLIVVDVTPRRTREFRPRPGETIHYRFGPQSGELVADADGTVTVPELRVTKTTTLLELERDAL